MRLDTGAFIRLVSPDVSRSIPVQTLRHIEGISPPQFMATTQEALPKTLFSAFILPFPPQRDFFVETSTNGFFAKPLWVLTTP